MIGDGEVSAEIKVGLNIYLTICIFCGIIK